MIIIAISTFRELIRERLVHIILLVVGLMFGVSFLIGALSFDEQTRILVHFGFAATHLSLMGLSAFIGSSLLAKEIDRQTCLIVLARPLTRVQFYFGKWLGIAMLNLLIDAVLMTSIWLLAGSNLSVTTFAKIGFGIFFESMVLLSFGLFGSLFLRPAISFFMVIGVFLIGNWLEDLAFFADKSKDPLYKTIAKIIHDIAPQLYRANWRSFSYFSELTIPKSEFLWVGVHTMGWTMVLLILGCLVFRRKDLV